MSSLSNNTSQALTELWNHYPIHLILIAFPIIITFLFTVAFIIIKAVRQLRKRGLLLQQTQLIQQQLNHQINHSGGATCNAEEEKNSDDD